MPTSTSKKPKKKSTEPVVTPAPRAQRKNAAHSLSPSDAPDEAALRTRGNSPPPKVVAVPLPKDKATRHQTNPSDEGSVVVAAKLPRSDLDTVLLDGIPDVAPGSLPIFVRQLRSQGVVPLETVTYRALLDPKQLDAIRARGDYPEWDRCVRLYALPTESERRKIADSNPVLIFQPTPICRNDPKFLAEVLTCILLSCESTPSTEEFGCAVFRQLWLWLHRAGIGGDDGLALVEASDLIFPVPHYPDLGKLFFKRAFLSIIEAVRTLQGLTRRLYLSRHSHFSWILRVVADPACLSPPAPVQPSAARAVTFDPASARLSTAPPDLDLPFLAADASDFLDYKKDVEYRFQSRGVKQYLHEMDQQQLMSSWSEAFCARLHSSISKSTISYLNEQMKQEVSVARLWDGIKKCFDDAGQRLNRELKQWLTLFSLSVESVESFPGFLNVYKTSVSQLLAAKSIALGDPQLMRALIMRSVTCDEFHSVMIELNKKNEIQHEEMVRALEDHFRAYQHRVDITGNSPGTKSVRRGTKTSESAQGDGLSQNKHGWNVPPIPNSLRDATSAYVFNQLRKWRNHCNKEHFSAEDEQKRKDWVFTKYPPGGGGGDSDGQVKRSGKDRGGGGRRRDSRGSKKNHHRNRDRRGRRGERSSRSRSASYDSRAYSDDDRSVNSRDRGIKKARVDGGERRSRRSARSPSSSPPRRSSSRGGGNDANYLFGGGRRKS